MNRLLLKPVPLYLLLLAIIALPTAFVISKHINTNKNDSIARISQKQDTSVSIHVIRLQDTGLIKPLLFVESNIENPVLQTTKNEIIEYINRMKKEGILSSASIYMKDLNNSYCFVINPNEYYDPASLIKVALLLYVLSLEDQQPGVLNQEILFSKREGIPCTPVFKSKTIELGKKYTMKELLYYMIVYSDNDAFNMIGSKILMNDFIRFLNYFEIPMLTDNVQRADNRRNFIVNVNSMSRFFRVLYNSTFLSRKNSQFALELLSQSDFKMGILRELPSNIKAAHKFGERTENGVAQLHEFGIIYLDNKPYLIGVMTKGTNMYQLTDIIAHVSKIVFNGVQKIKPN